MINGLMARKLGMSRVFGPDGSVIPVTVLEAGPCTVIQLKTQAKDGYQAVQIGFRPAKERRVAKPERGHMNKAGKGVFKHLREFVPDEGAEFEAGQELTVELFNVGDKVDVTSRSKGKGFAGIVKRYHFRAGKETHGCTSHRVPGSIGASAYPSRVIKGKKMPGHLGNARTTVRNLKVIDVRPETNLLLVKGAVPGAMGSVVMVKRANSGASR